MNVQAERHISSLELVCSRGSGHLLQQVAQPAIDSAPDAEMAGEKMVHNQKHDPFQPGGGSETSWPLSEQGLERVRSYLEQRNLQLRFEVDRETGALVMALRDARTGELVRQIPPEERLRFMQRIDQYLDQLRQNTEGALITTRA